MRYNKAPKPPKRCRIEIEHSLSGVRIGRQQLLSCYPVVLKTQPLASLCVVEINTVSGLLVMPGELPPGC